MLVKISANPRGFTSWLCMYSSVCIRVCVHVYVWRVFWDWSLGVDRRNTVAFIFVIENRGGYFPCGWSPRGRRTRRCRRCYGYYRRWWTMDGGG